MPADIMSVEFDLDFTIYRSISIRLISCSLSRDTNLSLVNSNWILILTQLANFSAYCYQWASKLPFGRLEQNLYCQVTCLSRQKLHHLNFNTPRKFSSIPTGFFVQIVNGLCLCLSVSLCVCVCPSLFSLQRTLSVCIQAMKSKLSKYQDLMVP